MGLFAHSRLTHSKSAYLTSSAYLVASISSLALVSVAQGQTHEPRVVEEIIVTAQKRTERLQDVPVAVAAISTEVLTSSSQLRLQDYYNKIPGLGVTISGNAAAPALSIRGISAIGTSNPAVGVVVDDVPYGSTVNPGTAPVVADIDPGDLQRIEVLRGPQGTLYGAASIGGLLKYVTIDPSTEGFSARVQVGSASVSESSDQGYNYRGAVNMPFGDTLAVRASAFKARDAGYIDNVRTGQRDINRRDAEGGRLAMLWRPSDNFSLKLSGLTQDSDRGGSADVNRSLLQATGNLQQSTLGGTGIYERHSEAYSAAMTGTVGRVELTSITGYTVDEIFSVIDSSFFCAFVTCFGATGAVTPFPIDTSKLTQEVRMFLPIGDRVDWQLGAYYAEEDLDTETAITAVDVNTGAVAGSVLHGTNTNQYEELAVFTNLTFRLTERLDVQVGGRQSRNELDFSVHRDPGPLFGAVPVQPPFVHTSDTPFTYLVTPRFKFSPDVMMYARLASGYRPGGAVNCSIPVPCTYKADTTRNYEIGFKGDLFDRALYLDASVYYIDWDDTQVTLAFNGNPVLPYTSNAGRAKSEGVEVSARLQPLAGLTVEGWVAVGTAELTETLPATVGLGVGREGDRLPNSSRVSASLSADQEFSLWDRATLAVGASVSYVGDRAGPFRPTATAPRQEYPSYVQVDLRAGFEFGTWTVDLFANNVTDKRGLVTGDPALSTNFFYIQPRTIGLNLAKAF